MALVKADQRREADQRTQARLLDAALNLLAARGEDDVTLRTLTGAAGANAAAVSHHSARWSHCATAAVEHPLERYLDAPPNEDEVAQTSDRWRPYRCLAVSYPFASGYGDSPAST